MIRFRFHLAGLLLVLLSLLALTRPADTVAADPPSAFATFVDDYYVELFQWDPNQATYAGVHDYDDKLSDLSAANIAKHTAALKKFQERLKKLRDGKLSAADTVDAAILDSALRAELLELEVVRDWKRNPMTYLGKAAEGIDMLMKRKFAPAADRLKAIVGRLKAAPALLAAMKANIDTPPKEFTDLGIIVAKGSAGFFAKDLPEWAKTAAGADAKLLAEFEAANKSVAEGFESAAKWLEKELLPKSTGKYAIGAETFLKKLEYEEMVDGIPLDKLLAIGEAALKRDRDLFIATAKKLDPNRTPQEVLRSLSDDHPKPDDLVDETRKTLEQTRRFLIDKKIVSIPSEVPPIIAETPPFARTGGFASMDTPGAYEKKATEAFYYVTPPEKEWDAQRKTEHMRMFNKTTLEILTIHEAYPGHYLQFLNAKDYPTKVRKLYTCGTNAEGWAHYAEQMCVEEGYGTDAAMKPERAEKRKAEVLLAQLSDALLRDCRYVVGIKLHTADWTVEQGKKFFVEQGFIEPEGGFQESRRGTYNPTYLYYTLGKLQIYKFREDYKKAKGAAFSLQKFHDDFVKQGGIPIKLIRGIMLPGDTGPSL